VHPVGRSTLLLQINAMSMTAHKRQIKNKISVLRALIQACKGIKRFASVFSEHFVSINFRHFPRFSFFPLQRQVQMNPHLLEAMVAQQKPKMVKQPQPKRPKKNANLTEATSGNPL
jgi:hypothetical protein